MKKIINLQITPSGSTTPIADANLQHNEHTRQGICAQKMLFV